MTPAHPLATAAQRIAAPYAAHIDHQIAQLERLLADFKLAALPAASDAHPLASRNHAPAFEAGRGVTGIAA